MKKLLVLLSVISLIALMLVSCTQSNGTYEDESTTVTSETDGIGSDSSEDESVTTTDNSGITITTSSEDTEKLYTEETSNDTDSLGTTGTSVAETSVATTETMEENYDVTLPLVFN